MGLQHIHALLQSGLASTARSQLTLQLCPTILGNTPFFEQGLHPVQEGWRHQSVTIHQSRVFPPVLRIRVERAAKSVQAVQYFGHRTEALRENMMPLGSIQECIDRRMRILDGTDARCAWTCRLPCRTLERP